MTIAPPALAMLALCLQDPGAATPRERQPAAAVPVRGSIRGVAYGPDGRPFAGGAVELFHRSWQAAYDNDAGDVVRLRCDAEGRFEGVLRRGLVYSAWVHSPRAQPRSGEYFTSGLTEGVVADRAEPLSLHCGADPSVRVRLELESSDAWEADGPLAGIAWTGGDSRWHARLDRVGPGRFVVPMMPARRAWISLRTPSGLAVGGGLVTLWKSAREQELGAPAAEPRTPVAPRFRTTSASTTTGRLADRGTLAVRIVDPSGKGCGGARICDRDRGDRRVVATTDDSGRATLPIPSFTPEDGGQRGIAHYLWVDGEHVMLSRLRPPTMAGVDRARFEAFDLAEERVLALPRGLALTGRLLLREGEAAADVRLLLCGAVVDPHEHGSSFGGEQHAFTTAADGSFASPRLLIGDCGRAIVAALAEWHLVALGRRHRGAPMHPRVLLGMWSADQLRARADDDRVDLGALRLDRMVVLDLALGEGVAPTDVVLVSTRPRPDAASGDRHAAIPPEPVALRSGRARVLAAPGLLVRFAAGDATVDVEVATYERAGPEGIQAVVLGRQ